MIQNSCYSASKSVATIHTLFQVGLSFGRRILATDGRSRPMSSPLQNICFNCLPVPIIMRSFRIIKANGKSCSKIELDNELRLFEAEGPILSNSRHFPFKTLLWVK